MSAQRRSPGTATGSSRVARIPSVLRLLDEEKNPIGDARESWVAAEEAEEFKESPHSNTPSSGADDCAQGGSPKSLAAHDAASLPVRPKSRRELRASTSMTDISLAASSGSGVGSGQRRSSFARRRLLDAKRVDRQLAPMQGSGGEGASKPRSPTHVAATRASPLEPLLSPSVSLRSQASQSASLSSSPVSPYARSTGPEPSSPRLGPFPPARPSSRGSGPSPRRSPTLRSRRVVATGARLEPLSPPSPQPAVGRLPTPAQRRRPAGGEGFELPGVLPMHGTRVTPRRRAATQQ